MLLVLVNGKYLKHYSTLIQTVEEDQGCLPVARLLGDPNRLSSIFQKRRPKTPKGFDHQVHERSILPVYLNIA